MIVEQAIAERLLADATVAGLVATDVYQLKLPQEPDLPAVRIQLISVVDRFHLRGGSLVEQSRVQIDAVAEEGSVTDPYAQASAVADAVHASLNGQVFVADPTLRITGAFRDSRIAMYDPDQLRQVSISQDYIVWTRRAA